MRIGPFNVHVADEVGAVAAASDCDVRGLLANLLPAIADTLKSPQARIDIRADAKRAIPTVGVGGFTNPFTGHVSISFDLTGAYEPKPLFERWLPALLAHELHHSKRVSGGPGYGFTLLGALVSEGAADCFVEEFLPDLPPSPWTRALDDSTVDQYWSLARPALHRPHTPWAHSRWFFGSGDVPPWTGYTIGYRIAAARLAQPPTTTAALLAGERGRTIFSRSAFSV